MQALIGLSIIAGVVGVWFLYRWSMSAVKNAKGPMVQMVSSTGFTLVWNANPGAASSVHLSANDDAIPSSNLSSLPSGRFEARFDNLQPGRDYGYQIEIEGQTIFRGVASTAPTPESTFRIIAFGDSGSGDSRQARLARRMQEMKPDIVIHTGDLVCPSGEAKDYFKQFHRPYRDLIARTPFYTCVGNHDCVTDKAAPMFAEFVLPANGPDEETPQRHYWLDFGSTRFVSIDTNLEQSQLADLVAPWLDEVLAGAGNLYRIVYFHHPVYTNGKYHSARRLWSTLVPVLEAHRVHLVLSGHNHMYERTHPIRNQEVTETGQGVVYVTTGAGGSELYPVNADPIPQITVQYNKKHSFTVIDVDPQEARLRQINIQGETVDEFAISRIRTTADEMRDSSEPLVHCPHLT